MPRSPRRITRKDIRQPDRFVALVRQGISLLTQHRTRFAVSAAILAAILVALLGWDFYRSRQNRLAAAEYTRAVNLYHGGRYQEALEAFSRVGTYRSSFYGRLGLLYAANTEMALGETGNAFGRLRELLVEKGDPLIRQAAYMSLAAAQEEAGQCQEAAVNYDEAEKIRGPFTADATLGKARCSARSANPKEALASYRKFLTDNPGSETAQEAALRVQELEGKVREGSAAGK